MSSYNKTDNELSEMLKQPYVGHEKLMTLVRRYKRAKDPVVKDKIREDIFRNNVRFIRKAVLRRAGSFPDRVEDTFNAAVISFFEGLEKFKPNRGFKFHTYIGYWIDKAIYESYVGGNIVNLPRGNFFKKGIHDVDFAKNGSLIYLDKEIANSKQDGFTSVMDSIGDKLMGKWQLDKIDKGGRIDDLREALVNALTAPEFTVVYWKYLCEPALTYDELALILGCCRENARQTVFNAMWKLKKYMESDDGSTYSHRRKMSSKISEKLNLLPGEKERIYKEMIDKRSNQ